MQNLVVVESPGKAKTIEKLLGPDYKVIACYGHVRDLKPKKDAIDIENGFLLHYENSGSHTKHIKAIEQLLKKSDKLILATDPDREGEAIAWNLVEIFKGKKFFKDMPIERVAFNQITKKAIHEAINSPRTLDMDLVYAQQARRALDYLVGFNLSPLLWKKVQRGLSAGRVQSPALRLIVERENEIRAFTPQEYWSVHAFLQNYADIKIQLTHYNDTKLGKFDIPNETEATAVVQALGTDKQLKLSQIKKQQRTKKPSAPLITSTLQQEASKRLGYSATRTMRLAQTLYEGVDINGSQTALITYMRTDSTHLAPEAEASIRQFIGSTYGTEYLPSEPRKYKTKSKNAQEAHEAIRPIEVTHTPESLKSIMEQDLWRLYKLIWERTVSSQMTDAKLMTETVIFDSSPKSHWKCTGSRLVFDGYLRSHIDFEYEDYAWPDFKEGDTFNLDKITPNQHFTEPPPRFNEASLIKTLEEFGIGRPSTYASIINTLTKREYALLENKRFMPTDTGEIVSNFLVGNFEKYVDYEFTAHLEDSLDEISLGKESYNHLLDGFWQPFEKQVGHIDETVKRSDVTSKPIDEKCPECDAQLLQRLGRSGVFIGCSAYPDCKYTRSAHASGDDSTEAKSALASCPKCDKGEIIQKRSKRGKIFFACNQFPTCQYPLWNKPLTIACPACKWPIMTEKVTKKYGTQHVCPECNHTENVEDNDS